MHPSTVELMRDQVRAIYRAATGSELVEGDNGHSAETPQIGEVAVRFADLEAMARTIPGVAERVPPFYVQPPIDVIDDDKELVIELAVPGIDKGDVTVDHSENVLIISGVRRGERSASGATYLRAEIPRGPFTRAVELPCSIDADPRVEVQRGLISIRVAKPAR